MSLVNFVVVESALMEREEFVHWLCRCAINQERHRGSCRSRQEN